MAADVARTRRRRRFAALGLVVFVASFVAVANMQVTTRQGVNFEVATHRLPLYLKGLQFIDRDAQYRQVAGEITKSLTTDVARALALFDWTQRHVRPTPDGWPVVDDHILNIIIRGHGTADQRADVFAMLATYAGVPAFWRNMKAPGKDGVILSFALVDGRWVVFDVANRLVFRNEHGGLATLEELGALPEYAQVLGALRTPPVPEPLRAELQMPWRRLWYETKVTLRLEYVYGSQR